MSTHDDFRPDDHTCEFSQGVYGLAYRCKICDRLPRTDERLKRALEVVEELYNQLALSTSIIDSLRASQEELIESIEVVIKSFTYPHEQIFNSKIRRLEEAIEKVKETEK